MSHPVNRAAEPCLRRRWTEPRPLQLNHLVGDAYENDLKRDILGYKIILGSVGSVVVSGVAAGLVANAVPAWAWLANDILAVWTTVVAVLILVAYVLISRNTVPPSSVTPRISSDDRQ